jgi:hypothetical protein
VSVNPSFGLARKALALCGALLGLSASAEVHTYDVVWYSGASQTWVYEAGAKVLVDVYDDLATPENDVVFRIRNAIDTELGYQSSVSDLQIDTGTVSPDMVSGMNLDLANSVGFFDYYVYPPGSKKTLIDDAANRVAWMGEFAAGRTKNADRTGGVNPGEALVLRLQLAPGVTFTDVIQAVDTGLSTTYLEGRYNQWTNAQRALYRAEAVKGLRVALLVHSIVPNSWHPDGHGLFVLHRKVSVGDEGGPQITAATATPSNILDNQTSQLLASVVDGVPGPADLSYGWSVISGGGSFDDPHIANPVFFPPDVVQTTSVILRVEVSDGETTVSRDVTVQVTDANAPPPNQPPQIDSLAATPSTIYDSEQSQLSVVASDPDGGPGGLTYQWTVVSGGGVLQNANGPSAWYTPADVVGSQAVTLRVTVSDGAASVSGDVTLTVQDANPPPPGAQLLAEDFGSGSLAGWQVVDEGTAVKPSKWRIVSGELAHLSNIYGGSTASGDLARPGTYLLYGAGSSWTNYRVKFKVRATDDDGVGLMFRVADSDNYYRFSWDRQMAERRLVKKAGGVFTLLAADSVPYVLGQSYQIEIVANGGQLEVWIDGARIFQANDTTLAQGTIAFYTWRNNAAYFDDVLVTGID